MAERTSQVQIEKEIRQVNKRLDDIAFQFTLLLSALKKNKVSGLDRGIEELMLGKYHTYKSVKELDKAIRAMH